MNDDIRPLPLPFGARISASAAIALLGIVAAVAFASGYAVALKQAEHAAAVSGAPSGVDLTPVWRAWRIIDDKFVPASVATSSATSTGTEDERRVWGMVQGLAASLNDPYTFFLPPSENQEFNDDMSGSFEGVGMEIAVRDQVLTVVSPLKGTPAERAGIKSGDRILKIDDVSTQGMDTQTAVRRIRGPKNTEVVLHLYRDGWSEPRDMRVMRDVINVPIVTTTARPDGVFVITVATFTSNAPDLFRSALREFIASGDSKLILDLRGNPGGYLEAAVNMGSWFLPTGRVIVTEDYAGHAANVVHRSYGYNIFNKNLRMAVLVDRGSASASEILADALHHYGVATLVGVNTFGKGSVQELVDITHDTALKLTVARWLGPDGVQIPKEGITPDVTVSVSDEDAKAGKDPQLERAVSLLKE